MGQRRRVPPNVSATIKGTRLGHSCVGRVQGKIGVLWSALRFVYTVSQSATLQHNDKHSNVRITDESNGVFPRVEQCKDGSWCCYNLENESKAETCCASGLGTFLDDTGVVTNGPASSTSSSAGSATSTSRTTKTSNPSASASPTSAPDSSGLSTGAKIGLGVGIGLGVLVLAAASIILWLLLRKRRNNESEPSKEASSKEASSLDELQPNSDVRSHYAEVPDSSRGEPYQDYKAYLHAPAEMSGEQSRHEMDGSSPQELPVGHIREVNDGK